MHIQPVSIVFDMVILDPDMMPRMQVDKGAIPFVLSGANVMCPGFTSPGGSLPTPIDADVPVVSTALVGIHVIIVDLCVFLL